MSTVHKISNKHLGLDEAYKIVKHDYQIELSKESKEAIVTCRKYLEKKFESTDEIFYGINTGFGDLCNVEISKDDIDKLQENLVKSHACGVGEVVPAIVSKLMLLLKIQSLAYGHSGIRLETIERLVVMFNKNVTPVIYTIGSLGASGDLAPLAHLSLPLIGLGEVQYEGEIHLASEINKMFDWEPLNLKAKEGLALLNGTQFMSAYGVFLIHSCKVLLEKANIVASMALDGFDCKLEPFSFAIHKARKQPRQLDVATNVKEYLNNSEIASKTKEHIQDPYSFRCIPQVHGASWQVIDHVEEIITNEINSVTDNPNIFPEEDSILSGGNFHGQPLAMAIDYLTIAISELGSISERRTYLLQSGERNLPSFLVEKPGLNSGLMIAQYTAAALVNKSKTLCFPASADSVTSSNGQEDHVSMGANAATKCFEVLENSKNIISIELLCASQALDTRRPLKSSSFIEGIHANFRKVSNKISVDRILYVDIQKAYDFLFED